MSRPIVTWTHHDAHGEETRIEAYEHADRGWPGIVFTNGYFRNPDELRDFAAALVEAAGWLEARNLGQEATR